MEQEENYQKSIKRSLTVYRKFIPRSDQQYVILPEIRLCGKWLSDMGFDCGQKVSVQQEKNKLVITIDGK